MSTPCHFLNFGLISRSCVFTLHEGDEEVPGTAGLWAEMLQDGEVFAGLNLGGDERDRWVHLASDVELGCFAQFLRQTAWCLPLKKCRQVEWNYHGVRPVAEDSRGDTGKVTYHVQLRKRQGTRQALFAGKHEPGLTAGQCLALADQLMEVRRAILSGLDIRQATPADTITDMWPKPPPTAVLALMSFTTTSIPA